MSLTDRLRWAVAPDPRRAMSIMLMALVMLAAWLVGACGMLGYFRWFFGAGSSERTSR